MSPQFSSSSTAADTSRTSSPSSDIPPSSPLRPQEEEFPDPSLPSSPTSSVIASPPLDTRPYSPHGVGIGILSPQPVLGSFAPISRASFSPLQVKSFPAEQRSNPLEQLSPRRPTSPFELPHGLRASGSLSPEILQPPPPPAHALRYVEDVTGKDGNVGEHIPLTSFSSTGGGVQTGLRISIPPLNPTTSTSTPSPPLLSQPTQDPVAVSLAHALDPAPSGAVLEAPATAATVDLLAPSIELNIDFSEFDTEGCSALEKIYLFSRSRASFHRVFIAHALPRYLVGAEASAAELPSREIMDRITPSEAVEYVLPLLNGLAMDEDEAVKEALAAELVPIIWWFITHCRLVEEDVQLPPSPPASSPLSSVTSHTTDDEASPPRSTASAFDIQSSLPDIEVIPADEMISIFEDAPTMVPVQAFTPILGTLLLSPNGTVGGSARYAVVELLRRLRRADQRDDQLTEPAKDLTDSTRTQEQLRSINPSSSQSTYSDAEEAFDVGLCQRDERRLFERELVYQVVIGMGRLDIDDSREGQPLEDFAEEVASDSDTTTAIPTPQPSGQTPESDSYFPSATTLGLTTDALSTFSAASPPAHTVDPTTVGIGTLSPSPSLSPSVGSASPPSGSPGHSSTSTPSLTSSTSSSSGEYSDNAEANAEDSFDLGLPGDISARSDSPTPMDVDEVIDAESKVLMIQPIWIQSSSQSMAAALPTTPPFEVPPQPPVAAPVPVSADVSLPITRLPAFHVQVPSAGPLRKSPPHQIEGWISPSSAAKELALLEEQQQLEDASDVSEEAAIGRLSSMSLMAAVTASGAIGEDIKKAFVTEVERVGRDPVYWVRREASFAVGALAKVVPVEVVTSSLLPLFESLCQDPTWHVRHSVLFALPAILSRLTPEHRRQLALDVILPLSLDQQSTVRSAVLEALGEVMHTFADDQGGPPEQLLKLFFGIRETEDPGGGTLPIQSEKLPIVGEANETIPHSATSISNPSSAWSDYDTDAGNGPDIYDDPQRPLVCAFNYPAVALTLGRQRWPELRSYYLSLARDPSFKIRRTLAASLGEIAKIIGEEQARADLVDVFWSSLRAEESEVRMKVTEALQSFIQAIAIPDRVEVVRGFEEAFSSGMLSSWRERENAVKALSGLVEVEGVEGEVLLTILVKALDDRVAAVREAAVAVLPAFVEAWRQTPTLLEALRADIRAFAISTSFRRRTTYVTCIQEMLVSGQGDMPVRSDTFWEALSALIRDPIVDVRIRVARLLGLISDKFGRDDGDIPTRTLALAQDLVQDTSHEVQAFAAAVVAGASLTGSDSSPSRMATLVPLLSKSAATFSRPPPMPKPS